MILTETALQTLNIKKKLPFRDYRNGIKDKIYIIRII